MNKPHEEFLEHSEKATDLLKRSIEIHKAEMAGKISSDEAIDAAYNLNEAASNEIKMAIDALEKPEANEPR